VDDEASATPATARKGLGIKRPNDQEIRKSRRVTVDMTNKDFANIFKAPRPSIRMSIRIGGNPSPMPMAFQAGTGIKKQSKALLKIRYLIQKHFLTGFPHSIKKAKRDPFDFVFIAKLAGLNRALAESFEAGGNLLNKYQKLNFNLFNNEYLAKM